MGDKVKPWQQRKPKHHGQNGNRGKQPPRKGDKKNPPFRASYDDRDAPIRNDWNERWEQ